VTRALLAWALSLLLAGPTAGEEASVRPGINDHYRDPDYAHWVRVFESPGREIYARRHAIVAALGLRPGQRVADIGSGTGVLSLPMAREVGPEGRVYMADISENFVTNALARARAAGLKNVEGVVNEPRSSGLAPGSVELVLVCDTYHHFEYPRSMLASLHQALSAGGELVIIDFRRQPGLSSPWVMDHVRAGREQVIAEVEAAGFRLLEAPELLRLNYFLRFAKLEREPPEAAR
jgi:predicted methyltransferase